MSKVGPPELPLLIGRIDLQEVVVGAGADVAAARRDDARRHGAAEAERIADGHHPIADLRRLVGELHEREVGLAVDLDQSEVGFGVGADHLRGVARTVIGRDLHRLGVIDDMVVGHRIAVGGDEEAGALAGDGLTRHAVAATRAAGAAELLTELLAELPKELVERRARHGRNVFLVVALLHRRRLRGGRGVEFHAHRNHRRLHLGDDVGKADWMLRGSLSRARGGSPRGDLIAARTGDQHGHAQRGHRRQQREAPSRQSCGLV